MVLQLINKDQNSERILELLRCCSSSFFNTHARVAHLFRVKKRSTCRRNDLEVFLWCTEQERCWTRDAGSEQVQGTWWWPSQEPACWPPPATFYSEAAGILSLSQQPHRLHRLTPECCNNLNPKQIFLSFFLSLFLTISIATCKTHTYTHFVSVTQLWSPSSCSSLFRGQ